MSYSFVPPVTPPDQALALVAANRLEGRPRSPEFNRALRAEVRDPTWLLARQWQLREFQAEDRGSPAYAELTLRALPLVGLTQPGQPGARPYAAAHQPLEAAVEAQPRPLGPGLRLQMGQYWLRLLGSIPGVAALEATARAGVLGQFAAYYLLTAPTAATDPVAYAQASTTPEVAALLTLAGTAALDGYQLYQALLATHPTPLGAVLADSDQLAAALRDSSLGTDLLGTYQTTLSTRLLGAATGGALNAAARQFVLAFHRLYLLGQDSTSWANERLAYAFTAATGGAVGLGSDHYPGGGALPWYAVDTQPAEAGLPAAPAAAAITQRRLATGVQFPGAPAARWWEFEDRHVDFGQITGDPSDWGRMLLQEFMFLYQSDWFSVPYTLDVGTLCAVDSVRVRDVFGRTYALQAAGAGQRPDPDRPDQLLDNDSGRWRLFAQTDLVQPAGSAVPQLYLPATVLRPLVGRPIEQVSFRREEATNLVWAVENVISDGFAGGLDGAAAAAATAEALRHLAAVPATDAASATVATYAYQLVSSVPENWVPFVPATDAAGRPVLAQGALPREVAGLPNLPAVQPRTTLLQGELSQPYYLHAHEVLPAGTAVQGLSYRARWHGGRTLHWFGRQRGPAQPGGSSGLAFDQLKASNSA